MRRGAPLDFAAKPGGVSGIIRRGEASVRAIPLPIVSLVALNRAQAAPSDGARGACEEGRKAYDLGRCQEAIEGFEKAHRLSWDRALLCNVAQSHRQAGHYGEPITIYQRPAGALTSSAVERPA
jgi:tetratricopeptide (TPR) repeat protein